MEGFVEKVIIKSSLAPVIAITEVGNLNSSNNLVCGMAIQEKSNRPLLKIFNHNGGTVEEEDFSRRENGKKYLILRNKKTNKVSIFGTKVTYLKKPDYFKLKTFEGQSLNDQAFNLAFGTKKSQRISNLINNDTLNTSKDIFENISSTEMKKPLSLFDEFTQYLPEGCNRFSNKLEAIYPVSILLNENEIYSMTDYANEVISMLPIPVDNTELSKFFILNINKLSHKTIQNISLLTFADGLVELLKTKSTHLNYGNNIIYPNSNIINDKVLDNFVEYSITGRDLTSKMKDKAVCYIIIIMFILNMFTIDLSWVSPFLPTSSQKRLILLMRVVGATSLKDDKTKYVLKIPLASLPILQKTSKKRK